MNYISTKHQRQTEIATSWLSELKGAQIDTDLLNMYPEGPIFASFNPVEIVSFLSRCADQEAEIHISDQEMTEVTLTTEFEFETMKEGQLELAFTLTSRYEDGSISFTISCIKEADGRILVFGDRSFAE